MKRAFFSTMSLPIIVAMVFAFALTFTFFGSAETAEAALSTAGKIASVEGKVAIFRKGKARGVRAKVGTLIFPGDKIKTYKDSRALLVLRDNSRIVIAPKSTMKMGRFVLNKKTEKRSAFLNILGGKIRIMAQKMYKLTASGKRKLWRNSSFKVKTPTAVVGVKGTDFIVTVTVGDKTYTGIVVVDGLVETRGIDRSGNYTKAVLISKLQTVTITENGVTSDPVSITVAEVVSILKEVSPEDITIEEVITDDTTVEDDTTIEDDTTVEDDTIIEDDTTTTDDTTTDDTTTDDTTTDDTTTTDTTTDTTTTTTTSGGGTTTCVSPPCP